MSDPDIEAASAALVALTEHNIPPDIQELLVYGNSMRGIPPGAISAACKAIVVSYTRSARSPQATASSSEADHG